MRRILDFAGLAVLVVLAWITYRALYGLDPLPQRIPTHFGTNGQPNAWGSSGTRRIRGRVTFVSRRSRPQNTQTLHSTSRMAATVNAW
jgi:hypothetical protein